MGDFPNFKLHFDLLEEEKNKNVMEEDGEPNQKTRFVSMAESERVKLLEESHSRSTKYTTKWVVSIFKGTGVYSYNLYIYFKLFLTTTNRSLSFHSRMECSESAPTCPPRGYDSPTAQPQFTRILH